MLRALLLSFLLGQVLGLKVCVIHMHGLFESDEDNVGFKNFIEKKTGIPVYLISRYSDVASLSPLKYQAEDILEDVKVIASQYDQVIAVGYSQGGIIWRSMIEMWDDHNVVLFISLASPQHGASGVPPQVKNIPFLDTSFAYSSIGQALSIFNYYFDPSAYDLYLKKNTFFTELNNEAGTSAEKEQRKKNFLKLSKLVLIGGSGDDRIVPWQSTVFGSYTKEGVDGGVVIPMEDSRLYVEDLFGLRSMVERGDLMKCVYPRIAHLEFRDDRKMLKRCVLPALKPYYQI